jgi:hypothetical protein
VNGNRGNGNTKYDIFLFIRKQSTQNPANKRDDDGIYEEVFSHGTHFIICIGKFSLVASTIWFVTMGFAVSIIW